MPVLTVYSSSTAKPASVDRLSCTADASVTMTSQTSYHKVTGPLSTEKAEVLIGRLREALVGLKEKEGRSASTSEPSTVVATDHKRLNDRETLQHASTVNDSKTWAGWDWPQGVALTVLYQASHLEDSDKSEY